MRRFMRLLAVGALAGTGGGHAMANDGENLLTNPGFEEMGLPGLPLGWQGINVGGAEWVDINHADGFVRSGSKSIKLPASSGGSTAFRGWTTNFFLPDGSDLYDPDYEYLGGDTHIIGYFLTPPGETLSDDVIGFKLEFRREPPNFSIYTSVEFNVEEVATEGEWVRFVGTFTDEDMLAVGDFPPYATSVSILPQRFSDGDPVSSGTIYWDDLCVIQGELPQEDCGPADLAPPLGTLDFSDVLAFLTAFSNADLAADFAAPFGELNFNDVIEFLTVFSAGCP